MRIAWNKGKKGIYTKETLEKMRVARLGKKTQHTEETKRKISESNKGKHKHWLGKKHSLETIKKMKSTQKKIGCPWFKGKKQTEEHIAKRILKGEKNPNWKGGITPANVKIRGSVEYKIWLRICFERDNHTCQKCEARSGNGKAIYLQVHHILNFSNYPELRFVVSNGITFCKSCHKEFHQIYGIKNNTIEQLTDFLQKNG